MPTTTDSASSLSTPPSTPQLDRTAREIQYATKPKNPKGYVGTKIASRVSNGARMTRGATAIIKNANKGTKQTVRGSRSHKADEEYTDSSEQRSTARSLNLDTDEGFMPSAANDFKFKYDSPTGRTAEELDELLEPAQYAPREQKYSGMSYSYKRFGHLPGPGLADRLVHRMEMRQTRDTAKEAAKAKALRKDEGCHDEFKDQRHFAEPEVEDSDANDADDDNAEGKSQAESERYPERDLESDPEFDPKDGPEDVPDNNRQDDITAIHSSASIYRTGRHISGGN